MNMGDMQDAIDMIMSERMRQINLYGDQSRNSLFSFVSVLGEEYGELCEAVNETCFANGRHPERGGYDNIIKEAVHVSAVAVQIIESAMIAERSAK